ncbi:MAG: PfkB family carbohydrate kinase [Rhodospirillales bacterium]|nr:PfkB family carbohydrate kinase [Rhodospirillales bacterium]
MNDRTVVPMVHGPASRPRDKIRSVKELGEISTQAKAMGLKVVLCHGVFDLLHMGHIRHLENARHEGNVLFVTVTADKHVNKGPGRPVFTEQLRAEMLAALEYVDWVAVNDASSAEPVLSTIRPDVYVKGSDYKNANEDVTGKINAERETVLEYGGKVVFTDDITFSSSNLINKYLNIHEPTLHDFLEGMREKNILPTLFESLDKLTNLRVLFVGDAIIDDYQYVRPLGKSPKENMIATLFEEREIFAGGVFAAANHVADLCKSVEVITSFGSHDSFEELARDTLKQNVKLHAFHRKEAPTTRKTRFIDTSYAMRKMFEVYFMDDAPLFSEEELELNALIESRIKDADVVVVTDFGHGLLNNGTVELLIENAKFLAVNTQTNSANHGFNVISKYRKADYICIDGPEARLAVHDNLSDLDEIISKRLPEVIDCPKIMVTVGKHGSIAYEKGAGINKTPALTSTIVDTVGAGDAFFSVTAPLVAAGVPMDQVSFLGNAVGALKVEIVGHRSSVEKIPLIKFLTALLK